MEKAAGVVGTHGAGIPPPIPLGRLFAARSIQPVYQRMILPGIAEVVDTTKHSIEPGVQTQPLLCVVSMAQRGHISRDVCSRLVVEAL